MDAEERRLWERYIADPSVPLRNLIAERYLTLVKGIARSIDRTMPVQSEWDVDSLASAGSVGLLRAIDKFDVAKGLEFSTYASQRIRGAILDALRSADWVPRQERKRLKDAGDQARVMIPVAFVEREGESDGIGLGSLLHPSYTPDVDADEFWEDELQGLGARQQRILMLYYRDELTMKQIGRSLGISESRVSQMMSAAVEQLRRKRSVIARIENRKEPTMVAEYERDAQQSLATPAQVASPISAAAFLDSLTIEAVEEKIGHHERELAAWQELLGVLRRRSGLDVAACDDRRSVHAQGHLQRGTIRRRILSLLKEHGPMSRRDVGQALGDLKSSSVSACLSNAAECQKVNGMWTYVGEQPDSGIERMEEVRR